MSVVIGDFFISLLIGIIAIKYFIHNDYYIQAIMIISIFIITSLAINLRKFIIATGLFLIGTIILFIYSLMNPSENPILFWIMFAISIIVLGSVLLFKRLLFNMLIYSGPTGDKGALGDIGKEGTSYILNNYPNRCYDELLNECEQLFAEILAFNKGLEDDYLKKNTLIKNMAFKQKLKQISKSYQFLDYVYNKKIEIYDKANKCDSKINFLINKQGKIDINGNNTDNVCKYNTNTNQRECLDGKLCNKTLDCVSSNQNKYNESTEKYNNEFNYNEIIKELKEVVKVWIKLILRNNKNDDHKMKLKYGKLDSDNYLNFNNDKGILFLQNEFYTPRFFKNDAYDPYIEIKKMNYNNLIIKTNPYFWSIKSN